MPPFRFCMSVYNILGSVVIIHKRHPFTIAHKLYDVIRQYPINTAT